MRVPIVSSLLVTAFLVALPASSQPEEGIATLRGCAAEAPRPDPWSVTFDAPPVAAKPDLLRNPAGDDQATPPRRVAPIEYSEGYKARAKIHKIASFATLPLFVANYVVAQDLYNNPGDESKKGLHVGLATSTGVLFGVNTVTGAWNLWEGRKDPSHRGRRMTHGILMMAADVGFLATAMLAPESEEHDEHTGVSSPSNGGAGTHRAVALTSMGIATVSYLIMLLGGR